LLGDAAASPAFTIPEISLAQVLNPGHFAPNANAKTNRPWPYLLVSVC